MNGTMGKEFNGISVTGTGTAIRMVRPSAKYDHLQPMEEFADDDQLQQLSVNPRQYPQSHGAASHGPPSGGLGDLFEQKEHERRAAPEQKPRRKEIQRQIRQQRKPPFRTTISQPDMPRARMSPTAGTTDTIASSLESLSDNQEDLIQSRMGRRSASVPALLTKTDVLPASFGSRMLHLLKRRHNLDHSKQKDSAKSALAATIPSHVVALCGTLIKQGSWRQNWKSRFFILRTDQPALCYFNSEDKLQLLGQIPITADTIVIDKSPAGYSPYRIQIRSDSKFLLVEAESRDTQAEWIETLQRLVDGIRNNKFCPQASSTSLSARALNSSLLPHTTAYKTSPQASFHERGSLTRRNSLVPFHPEDNQLEDVQRLSTQIPEDSVEDGDTRDSEKLYDICFELVLSRRGRVYRDAKSGEKTTYLIKLDGFSRSNKAFEEVGVTDAVKLSSSPSVETSSQGSSVMRVCFSLIITAKLERYEHLRVSLYKCPQRQNLGGSAQTCIGRGRCLLDDELLRVSRHTRIQIREKSSDQFSHGSSEYFGAADECTQSSAEVIMYLFNFAPTSSLAPGSELAVAHARFLLPVKAVGRPSIGLDCESSSLTNESFLGATTGKGSQLVTIDEILCIPRSTFGVAIAYLDYLEEEMMDRLHNLTPKNEGEESKINALEREFCRKKLEEYVKSRQLYWRQQHRLSGTESFEDAHLQIIQIRNKAKLCGEERYLLPFKQSTLKKIDEWQFIPTNMQNQFLIVEPPTTTKQRPLQVWHTMTMGCPAAHTKGFANGGYKSSADVPGDTMLIDSETGQTEQTPKTPRGDDAPMRSRKSVNNTPVEDTMAAVKSRLEAKDRLDVIAAQILSAVFSCILASVDLAAMGSVYHMEQMQKAVQLGYLVGFESLLSTHGKEWGMIEDFDAGVRWVRNVHVCFRLESKVGGGFLIKEYTPTPSVADPSEFKQVLVTIGLDAHRLKALPSELALGKPFAVNCVLFTQGINEKQSLVHAIKSGASKIQNRINRENLDMLKAYYNQMHNAFSGNNQEFASCFGSTFDELDDLLRRIEYNIMAPSHQHKKTVAVLVETSDFCRRIGGARVTCCKSGKDRTAMSITLEQARICYTELNAENVKSLCSNMRSHGVRRRNVFMNIKSDKFAFNEVQRKMLPDSYKPPVGTYKTGQT